MAVPSCWHRYDAGQRTTGKRISALAESTAKRWQIDKEDDAFAQLRVWTGPNSNGVAEADELNSLVP